MSRIAGVNLPVHKDVRIALTAIFGVGISVADKICQSSKVTGTTKVKDLSEAELAALREQVATYVVEGDLRREISMNIKRKMDMACYEGLRHRRGLPLKKNTKNNARTRKGKRKPIRA